MNEIVTAADLVNALEPLEASMWVDRFCIRSAYYMPRDLYDEWIKDTTKLEPIVELFFLKSVKVTRIEKHRVSLRIPLAMFMSLMVAASDQEISMTAESRNASLRRQGMQAGEAEMNLEAEDASLVLESLRSNCGEVIRMLTERIYHRWRECKSTNVFASTLNFELRLQTARRLEGVPSREAECCS